MSQYDAEVLESDNYCRKTSADRYASESSCISTKNSLTLKQLLQQCEKILALCNTKGEIASFFSFNIALSNILRY